LSLSDKSEERLKRKLKETTRAVTGGDIFRANSERVGADIAIMVAILSSCPNENPIGENQGLVSPPLEVLPAETMQTQDWYCSFSYLNRG
jgi:hypothetical protein